MAVEAIVTTSPADQVEKQGDNGSSSSGSDSGSSSSGNGALSIFFYKCGCMYKTFRQSHFQIINRNRFVNSVRYMQVLTVIVPQDMDQMWANDIEVGRFS